MPTMGFPAEKRRYTVAEYIEMEEKAADRHEFHDGEILAMSGGTYAHSVINTNTLAGLTGRLRGTPCRPLDSNMRVRIGDRLDYVYPDISVVCGSPQFDLNDSKQTTILNPRVVMEVLSDSTERYDRGRKFDLYRQIPSLEEFVLISQSEPLIETFRRQHEGGWLLNTWKGLSVTAEFQSLKISFPLSEIYVDVEFGSSPHG